jgi:hypothetical protein
MTKAHSSPVQTPRFDATSHKPLARVLVDALLEYDLLGVLLSGPHLRLVLCNLDLQPYQATAAAVATDPVASSAFHQQMIEMFTSFYIDECLHESKEALLADLDNKCRQWFPMTRQLSRMDLTLEHQLDLQRHYRKQCALATAQPQ